MRRGLESTALVWMLLLASCAGLGVAGSAAIQIGKNLLLNTAESNFGEEYGSEFGKMVDLLLLQQVAQVGAPAAAVKPATMAATADEDEEPEEAPAPAPAPPEPIRLDLAVLREVVVDGRPIPVPIDDGAVLRDGVGRKEAGDNLKIQFRADTDCYVYAVWIDATSWATPLFPLGPNYEGQNPVKAGQRYTFPEGNAWYYLDDYRGVESLYFLASREPITDLDPLLRDLVGRKREFRKDVIQPVTMDEPAEATRGLAGVREGAGALVAASDGAQHTAASQLFLARGEASQLLVTRWFSHQ